MNFFDKIVKNRDKLKYINPFIFPCISENNIERPNLKSFFNNNDFKILMSGNIRFFEGKELYGFKSMINATKKLKEKGENIKVLMIIMESNNQSIEEKEYYKFIKKQVLDNELQNYIFFYEPINEEIFDLFGKVNLFVRPTIVDGFGISLAESIYMKTPAIATDVCIRPNGTILYHDNEELANIIYNVKNNYDYYKNSLDNIKIQDSSKDILELYNNLLKKV